MLQSVNFWLQLIKFSFYLVLRGIHGCLGIRTIRFRAAYAFQLYLDDRPFSMSFLFLQLQFRILDILPFKFPP